MLESFTVISVEHFFTRLIRTGTVPTFGPSFWYVSIWNVDFMVHKGKRNRASHHKTRVKSLFLDYDGIISSLNSSRSHAQVPEETRMMLQRISSHISIIIVSTKDLSCLLPRTPFAHAWRGIAGIERRIGNAIKEHFLPETALEHIALGLQYAKSNATDADLFVEEKRDSSGRAVAFCLDWRSL